MNQQSITTPEAPKEEVSKQGSRTFDTKDVEENKIVTILSYFGILSLVPLLVKKESPFAQFHAKQGLALFLVWMLSAFVLLFIPIIGWMLIPLLHLLFLVVSIIGIVNVAQGKAWEIPVVKDVVKKLNI